MRITSYVGGSFARRSRARQGWQQWNSTMAQHLLLAQRHKALLVVFALALAACQPSVKVEAPQEPITINLNIKLDADVRLKIEEQAEQNIEENPDIF